MERLHKAQTHVMEGRVRVLKGWFAPAGSNSVQEGALLHPDHVFGNVHCRPP